MRTKCAECKWILRGGRRWIECGFGERRGVKGGTEGGLMVATEEAEREKRARVEEDEEVVGCSHRQAHSSCSACWDALGSVLHNTITACSGVSCWAPLCSDYAPDVFCYVCSVRAPLHSPLCAYFPCSVRLWHISISLLLNVLPTRLLSDLVQQTISISGAFGASSLWLWDLKCLLCLLQWFYCPICCHHSCTNSLLSSTLELEPRAWSLWLTGLPSLGLGDTSNHLVCPACLTALHGHTDVSGKL